MARSNLSTYLAFLLRHRPEELELHMDRHGWVAVSELLEKVNAQGRYCVTLDILEQVVARDQKGRYRFSDDKTRIKACQGHTIPWVEPELQPMAPPRYLYHGTTQKALDAILASGAVSPMKRHAVHMQAEEDKAWLSACRWKGEVPVVLKIDAGKMQELGYTFLISENSVWFSPSIPTEFICETIRRT